MDTAVITPEDRAQFIQRAVAYIIDSVIILIAGMILELFKYNSIITVQIVVILQGFIGVVYRVYFHSADGATPGKKMMKIIVVDRSGKVLNILDATMRSLFEIVYAIIFIYSVYQWSQSLSTEMVTIPLRDSYLQYVGKNSAFITVLSSSWYFASLVVISFSIFNRSIHDFICGSYVVTVGALEKLNA